MNGRGTIFALVGVAATLLGILVTVLFTYGGLVGRFGGIEQAVLDVRDDVRAAVTQIDELDYGYTQVCERLATLEALTREVRP